MARGAQSLFDVHLNLLLSPVNLFWILLFRIAMFKTFFVPTMITSFFALVTPV